LAELCKIKECVDHKTIIGINLLEEKQVMSPNIIPCLNAKQIKLTYIQKDTPFCTDFEYLKQHIFNNVLCI